MPLISMRQLLDHAAEHGYGMPAFNITNLETLQSVLAAADQSGSPVLVQASRSAISYAGDQFINYMFIAAVKQYPHLPICVHLDHGNSLKTCETAMALGFSSVMMDGSLREDGKTPSDYQYNADVTAEVVRVAHGRGISVEGEIGVLGSLETGTGEAEDGHGFEGTLDVAQLLTDPKEALQFVADTHVDALAVAVGTSHGAYKFSRRPTGEILAMHVIRSIHEELPNTHLVMHGASTIPQDLQELINDNGGRITTTFGVPLEEVEIGIKNGVRKINIDTDIRMAMSGSFRKFLRDSPASFDLRAIINSGRARTTELCKERFEMFGCAGMGARIKTMSLDQMADIYYDV